MFRTRVHFRIPRNNNPKISRKFPTRVVYSLRPKRPMKLRSSTRSTFYELQGQTPESMVFDLEVPRKFTLNLTAIFRVVCGLYTTSANFKCSTVPRKIYHVNSFWLSLDVPQILHQLVAFSRSWYSVLFLYFVCAWNFSYQTKNCLWIPHLVLILNPFGNFMRI